jgi:hypothetical protein
LAAKIALPLAGSPALATLAAVAPELIAPLDAADGSLEAVPLAAVVLSLELVESADLEHPAASNAPSAAVATSIESLLVIAYLP